MSRRSVTSEKPTWRPEAEARLSRISLGLRDPGPENEEYQDLTTLPWSPEKSETFLDLVNEATEGHWNSKQRVTVKQWQEIAKHLQKGGPRSFQIHRKFLIEAAGNGTLWKFLPVGSYYLNPGAGTNVLGPQQTAASPARRFSVSSDRGEGTSDSPVGGRSNSRTRPPSIDFRHDVAPSPSLSRPSSALSRPSSAMSVTNTRTRSPSLGASHVGMSEPQELKPWGPPQDGYLLGYMDDNGEHEPNYFWIALQIGRTAKEVEEHWKSLEDRFQSKGQYSGYTPSASHRASYPRSHPAPGTSQSERRSLTHPGHFQDVYGRDNSINLPPPPVQTQYLTQDQWARAPARAPWVTSPSRSGVAAGHHTIGTSSHHPTYHSQPLPAGGLTSQEPYDAATKDYRFPPGGSAHVSTYAFPSIPSRSAHTGVSSLSRSYGHDPTGLAWSDRFPAGPPLEPNVRSRRTSRSSSPIRVSTHLEDSTDGVSRLSATVFHKHPSPPPTGRQLSTVVTVPRLPLPRSSTPPPGVVPARRRATSNSTRSHSYSTATPHLSTSSMGFAGSSSSAGTSNHGYPPQSTWPIGQPFAAGRRSLASPQSTPAAASVDPTGSGYRRRKKSSLSNPDYSGVRSTPESFLIRAFAGPTDPPRASDAGGRTSRPASPSGQPSTAASSSRSSLTSASNLVPGSSRFGPRASRSGGPYPTSGGSSFHSLAKTKYPTKRRSGSGSFEDDFEGLSMSRDEDSDSERADSVSE